MFERKGLEFERFFNPERNVVGIASRGAVACEGTSSVREAVGLMLEGHRKIPVLKNKKFAGIVTVSDVLNYCGAGDKYQEFLKKKEPLKARVSTIMDRRVVPVKANYNLKKTMEVFKDFGRGSYPVLKGGRVVGMVSDWDFLKRVKWKVGVKVGEMMIKRPAQAKESYPILDAVKIMVKGGYRRLPVTKLDILTGIVLPFDALSFLESRNGVESLRKEKRNVYSIMKRDVVSVGPNEDVGRAVTLMLKHRVGGLPVVEDEELVGIITESDIVQGMV